MSVPRSLWRRVRRQIKQQGEGLDAEIGVRLEPESRRCLARTRCGDRCRRDRCRTSSRCDRSRAYPGTLAPRPRRPGSSGGSRRRNICACCCATRACRTRLRAKALRRGAARMSSTVSAGKQPSQASNADRAVSERLASSTHWMKVLDDVFGRTLGLVRGGPLHRDGVPHDQTDLPRKTRSWRLRNDVQQASPMALTTRPGRAQITQARAFRVASRPCASAHDFSLVKWRLDLDQGSLFGA